MVKKKIEKKMRGRKKAVERKGEGGRVIGGNVCNWRSWDLAM